MKEFRMSAAGVPQKGQSMMSDSVRRTEPLSVKKTEALNSKVDTTVALDLQLCSVVEDHGFKELMAHAVPNYQLLPWTTLSCTLVSRLYHDTWKKVKAELSSAFEAGTSRTAAIALTSNILFVCVSKEDRHVSVRFDGGAYGWNIPVKPRNQPN
ncbi:hypothetical protein HPB50_026193 [Hyalomma asiaticum]|uniref:Uncharacterized protein n=1 Tax=Hyalomma asiaticum TaxID=266040 RepID=A0ACB7TNL9_HYAAI|nr:hypothetical protein HPB50_026193 [Hyalomma asiaticum]